MASNKCGSAKPAASRPQPSSKQNEAQAEEAVQGGVSSKLQPHLGLPLPGTVPSQPQSATVLRAASRRQRRRTPLPSSTSSSEAQSCSSSSSSSGGHPQGQQAGKKPISAQYDSALSNDLRRYGMDLKCGPKPRKPPRERAAQQPSTSLPLAAGSTCVEPGQVRWLPCKQYTEGHD